MTLDQIPLFAMLKGKLGYLNDRQRLIAQNVANADTPGYAPTDLKPFNLPAALAAPAAASRGVAAATTHVAHIPAKPSTPKSTWKSGAKADSEVRLDGNQVVLEDQMLKMSEARLDYDSAIGLYQKSVTMLRLATRRPGS